MRPARIVKHTIIGLLTAALSLGAVVLTPGVSYAAGPVPSDATVTAVEVADLPAISRTFDVAVTSAEGKLLYEFALVWNGGSPPSVKELETWVKQQDPIEDPPSIYCVNFFSNYCVGLPGQ